MLRNIRILNCSQINISERVKCHYLPFFFSVAFMLALMFLISFCFCFLTRFFFSCSIFRKGSSCCAFASLVVWTTEYKRDFRMGPGSNEQSTHGWSFNVWTKKRERGGNREPIIFNFHNPIRLLRSVCSLVTICPPPFLVNLLFFFCCCYCYYKTKSKWDLGEWGGLPHPIRLWPSSSSECPWQQQTPPSGWPASVWVPKQWNGINVSKALR